MPSTHLHAQSTSRCRASSEPCPRWTASPPPGARRRSHAYARASTRCTPSSRRRDRPLGACAPRRARTGRSCSSGGERSRSRRSTGHPTEDPDRAERRPQARRGRRRIALWEDGGRPVSAVGFGSPTPTGIRIGPVYTPPELRGRGYASALTAHVIRAAARRRAPLLLPLHQPRQPDLEQDLRRRRLRARLRLGRIRVRLERDVAVLALGFRLSSRKHLGNEVPDIGGGPVQRTELGRCAPPDRRSRHVRRSGACASRPASRPRLPPHRGRHRARMHARRANRPCAAAGSSGSSRRRGGRFRRSRPRRGGAPGPRRRTTTSRRRERRRYRAHAGAALR